MLSQRTVADYDGITIIDVACRQPREPHRDPLEHAVGHGLVFVRNGCFVRIADGERAVLDPTLAYCFQPGKEERYTHPHADGDDCTLVRLDPSVVMSLSAGENTFPAGLLSISPQTDLSHRALLAAARRGDDEAELVEHAVSLVGDALQEVGSRPPASGRPTTATAHRALANQAREVLAADPGLTLSQLAHELAISPYHLSRVFRAVTGRTISRHRMRLRTRSALERLAGGEHDLALLAAELGFTDQSHLCRVIGAETHHTPAALRHLLS
jgi:AraC-like DNA-binding protein